MRVPDAQNPYGPNINRRRPAGAVTAPLTASGRAVMAQAAGPGSEEPRIVPLYWQRLLDLGALVLGLGMFIEIDLGGRLYLTEAAFLILLPFLLVTRLERVITWLPISLLVLATAWFGAQYVSNSMATVYEDDRIRVYARIAFLMINFLTLYLLFVTAKYRLLIFAVGFGIGWGTSVFLEPATDLEALDPWKFGVADSTMIGFAGLIGVVMFALRRPSILPAVGYAALSALSLYLVVRNSAGIAALSAVTLFVWYLHARRRAAAMPGLSRLSTLSILGALTLAAGVGVTSVYGSLAESGALGEGARSKYVMQTSNDLGLISGRSEFLASVPAIADSPIIGYGASRHAPGYMAEYLARKAQLGMRVAATAAGRDTVAAHSYLFGSWLEAGIVGALFWAFVFVLAATSILLATTSTSCLAPLIILGGFKLLWDISFSPLGAEARVFVPLFLAAIGYLIIERTSKQPHPEGQRAIAGAAA